MRKTLLCGSALALMGCASGTSYVHSDTTTLGRVVVYRNGVAYFERYAQVNEDKLTLAVPPDKIDDFLKSLNVADARTGRPTPVSYPTTPVQDGTGLVDMNIKLAGPGPHQLRLSYVTEAPAWKPSYRVVIGGGNSVDLDAWAVVDNTSGEDWKNVRLGVGSSSALSFRFDLQSVRTVERETLEANDLFAQAPPTGESTYGGSATPAKKIVGDFGDDVIGKDKLEAMNAVSAEAPAGSPAAGGAMRPPPPSMTALKGRPAKAAQPSDPLGAVARRLQSETGTVYVEGYAGPGDADKQGASLDRANKLRDRLVRDGLDASRVVAVGKGEQPGHAGGARVVEALDAPKPQPAAAVAAPTQAAAPLDPIGTSHFESDAAMTVPRGTSAMVSILHTPTDGEVVYLYDPETARGNAQFAFKSLRFRNPTESQLETGPLTVFGEGRFIGEGLCEPIPARQVAFVPFALDRQIVVDRSDGERDEIARIVTVQRGVFSTQVQHVRKATFVLHNRLPARAVVYLRHTVPAGYHTSKAPAEVEHAAGADLYRVEVEPSGAKEVVLEESTTVSKTTDIRSPAGMELVRVYLSSAAVEGTLKGQVDELVKVEKEIGDAEQRIATLREQMGEYRQRMDELHAQIVTLRAVKTAGPLMTSLEKKMQEVSDRLSKATIDVVSVEEKLMLARIKFQDGVADLSLEKGLAEPTSLASKS